MMENSLNQETDMIYNTEGGNTTAGGYSIESLLLNQGMPALYSSNSNTNSGGGKEEKVSDRFKHLAVPAGLFYMHESVNKTMNEGNVIKDSNVINDMNDSSVINDDLYEKLLKLAEHNVKETPHKTKQPKQTKKRANKIIKNKVTNKKTKRKY